MRWPYTKRADGRIAVTLDNNAWDFLFDQGIDLAVEFPAERFALYIPREVEIEADAIPDQRPVRDYIRSSIERAGIKTAATFGFYTGEQPQRRAGFNHGTFRSRTETEIYEALRPFFSTKTMGSGLQKNEGDAAVAVASFSSVVLTAEKPDKAGPLRFASGRGGKVLYLRSLADTGGGLRQHVLDCYGERYRYDFPASISH